MIVPSREIISKVIDRITEKMGSDLVGLGGGNCRVVYANLGSPLLQDLGKYEVWKHV